MSYSAWVHGVDNSPWTQATLLALHRAGVPFALSAVPTPTTFRANGYVIPACVLLRVDDDDDASAAPAVVDALGNSADIIRRIDTLVGGGRLPAPAPPPSSSAVDPDEEASRLEELFFEGATERFYPLWSKAVGFPWHFAQQREVGVSQARALLGAACKAVHCARFGGFLAGFALINAVTGKPSIAHPERTADALSWWEARLTADAPYLDGRWTMTTSDIKLFGQLQMAMSGLSEALVGHLAQRPRLLRWVAAMNAEFAEYPANRYTARVVRQVEDEGADAGWWVGPMHVATASGAVTRAPPLQVCVFYLALAFFLTLGLPLLGIVVLHSACKRMSNPHASGSRLDKTRYWGKVLNYGRSKKRK